MCTLTKSKLVRIFMLLAFLNLTECSYNKIKKHGEFKKELNTFLKSLAAVIEFCTNNKKDLDLNFEFGLFLVNVNLKSVLEYKHRSIPSTARSFIEELLRKNDELIEYFTYMVNHNREPGNRVNKMITTLFSNETFWMSQLEKFDLNLRPFLDDGNPPSTWSSYKNNVNNMNEWVPKPQQSDLCMATLAQNPMTYSDGLARCVVPTTCYDMLLNGTDFGYALTHRLLFLLQAKYSRGCSVFSPHQDQELRRDFCEVAYQESKYIAAHDYQIIDLMFEQICLCAFDGNTQFLQRSWLSKLLRFQTPYGCFGQKNYEHMTSRKVRTWRVAKRNHDLLDGLCNGHVTSVAAATLAIAIRYILEAYY